ncbi:MAG: 50S ribosomal protein L18 [bacterium]|nr:50S ribosomal protein L18 [bacterium]
MALKSRRQMTLLRHGRLRRTVEGSKQRPRLSVYRSERHIYAQLIDDSSQRTITAANSLQDSVSGQLKGMKPGDAAKVVGQEIAKRALEAGVKQVVFDRGGYKYHGRVKALADGAREAGLEF